MKKYRCVVCDWEYDPAAGDPDNGVAAGTAFEDIPDDWACPVCVVPARISSRKPDCLCPLSDPFGQGAASERTLCSRRMHAPSTPCRPAS